MTQIKDIPAGESWACKFKVVTFLDESGTPVEARNLQLGQAHPGQPGVYEGTGVIQVRDCERELVELWDPQLQRKFIVAWDSCSDPEPVEWL